MLQARYKVAVFDSVDINVLESILNSSPTSSVDLVNIPDSYGKDCQKELATLMKNYDGAVVRSGTCFFDALEHLPNLQFIGRAGIGVDNINGRLASKNGTIVFYAPDSNSQSVAEMVFFQLGGYLRSPEMQNMLLHQGENDKEVKRKYKGKELKGSTLSIIGVGDIGSKVLPIAQGFGLNLLLHDPVKSTEEMNALMNQYSQTSVEQVPTLEDALNADYITVHVPLIGKTEEHEGTRNLISTEQLKKVKEGAVLVNNSRAGIVDEDAVLQDLKNGGKLKAYITDVLSKDSPLLEEKNVFVTAHSAANTKDAQQRAATLIGESIRKYVLTQGEKVVRAYNCPTIEDESVDPYNLTRIAAAFSIQYVQQYTSLPIHKVTVIARGVPAYDSRALTMAAEAGIAVGFDRLKGHTDLPAHSIVDELGITVYAQQVKGAEAGFTPRIILEYMLSSRKKIRFVGQLEKDAEEGSRYAMKQIDKFGEHGLGRFSLQPTNYILASHKNIPAQLGRAASVIGEDYGFNISEDINLKGSSKYGKNMFVFPVTHSQNLKVDDALLKGIKDVLQNAKTFHVDLTGYSHRY